MTKKKIQAIMDTVKYAEFYAVMEYIDNDEDAREEDKAQRIAWEEVILTMLTEEIQNKGEG